MDKLVLTDTGGFPLKLDDLLWMDGRIDAAAKGMYDAIQSHLLAYGTDFIVEGCTYAAPNITAGWIMFGSELMRVDAAAGTDDYFVRTVTFDARGSKTFKDTTVNNTYEKIRGVLSGASGSLNITTALRLEDKIIQLLATSAQQFAVANIPDLPASKTTSGTFAAGRLPVATVTAIGAVEKATTAEAQAGTAEKYLDAALLQLVTATETRAGVQENATTAEAQALTAADKTLTPATLADVNGGLLTKLVTITAWNMNYTVAGVNFFNIAHSVTSGYSKIKSVKVKIVNDAEDTAVDFIAPHTVSASEYGGLLKWDDTTVYLIQNVGDGSFFDSTDFDSVGINRGELIIEYLP